MGRSPVAGVLPCHSDAGTARGRSHLPWTAAVISSSLGDARLFLYETRGRVGRKLGDLDAVAALVLGAVERGVRHLQ